MLDDVAISGAAMSPNTRGTYGHPVSVVRVSLANLPEAYVYPPSVRQSDRLTRLRQGSYGKSVCANGNENLIAKGHRGSSGGAGRLRAAASPQEGPLSNPKAWTQAPRGVGQQLGLP